jgi:LPXTG-site transpeptidase (sortase) family protein
MALKQWDVLYEYCADHPNCTDHGQYHVVPSMHARHIHPVGTALSALYALNLRQVLGLTLLFLGIGGIVSPLLPSLRLESSYLLSQAFSTEENKKKELAALPASVPVVLDPLVGPDGASIAPASEQFGLIIPKIGVNAAVIPGVDPSTPERYNDALKAGVAHASTSFFPDENGTVYLFSHSTNYDWFVQDLNAIFYLVKNLEPDDVIVLMYKGRRYTYEISEKKVVSPSASGYLYPYVGHRNLILQTCWPPGSTTERLLIFANLIEEEGQAV